MNTIRIHFKDVRKNTPHAFDALVNWYSLSYMISNEQCEIMLTEKSNVINNRRLFEFFDSHVVVINIRSSRNENGLLFTYDVEGLVGGVNQSTRLECEYEAFMQAFQWMDKKIRESENKAA